MRERLALVVAIALTGCSLSLDPSDFLARDGGDQRTDGSMDSGMDGGPADGGDCRCPSASDVCVRNESGDPICQRVGAACGSCPSGYACAGGACECADSATCGAACTSDADCGTRDCDPIRGVCRPPLGCLNYLACEEICIDLRCAATGDVPTGGACRSSDDCFEGLCRGGFCEPLCLYNDECGAGRTCAFLPGSLTSTCVPTPPGCETCTDEVSRCLSNGECLWGCEEQFECDEGEQCVLSANGMGCKPSPLGCGEGEVVIESAGACGLPLGCYTDDDPACPVGFECRSQEALGLGNSRETGFCVAS